MQKLSLGWLMLFVGILLSASPAAQAMTWTGPSTGDWNTPGNWTPVGPPTASDDVTIAPGFNVTVTLGSPIGMTGTCRSLTLGGGSFVATLNLGAAGPYTGTLTIGTTCTVGASGTLNVGNGGAAGTLTGGTTSITPSGTVNMDSSTISNTTLTNNGTFNILGTGSSNFLSATINNAAITNWTASNKLLLNMNSTFNNQATGAFYAQNDQIIDSSPMPGTFNNAGSFNKSNSNVGAATTVTANVAFTNTGTISIPYNNTLTVNNLSGISGGTLAGTYLLTGTYQFMPSMPVTALSGSVFLQSNTANLKILGGGNITSSSGVVSISNGAVQNLTGPFTTSGTMIVSGGSSLTISPGDLVITSTGSFSLDGSMLNIPSGIVNNQGLFFGGNSATVSGSLTNSGTLSVNTDQILHISGNYTQTSAGNFEPSITSPVDFGVLNVSGTATLDGTLFIIPSYTPATGNAWKLLTYASHSGQFATVNSLSSGFSVSQTVNPGDITATVGAFVGNPPIIFFIDVSATAAESNTPITFNAIAADINGLPLNYHWDFGDGSTGSGSPITHSFPSDANWTVTVHVDNGAASSTATVLVTTLSPNSGGAGIPNVGDGQSAPNPLNGFSITLVKSDGGLCQFNIDINALIRANFNVSTAFDTIDGRNSTVVGLQPVFKADQSNIYIATSSATDSTTNVLAGKARKTIGMSGAEVGATPQVKTQPKNHGIAKASTKGKFQFPKTTAASIATPDTVTFSGSIELPEGLDLSPAATREFQFSVGNILDSITINSKGKSIGASKLGRLKKVSISFPHLPKGTTSTPANITTKFQVMVSQAGMSLNGFDTEGITNTYAASEKGMKSVKRSVQVAMVFAGVVWQTTAPVSFTLSPKADSGAISGRSGL